MNKKFNLNEVKKFLEVAEDQNFARVSLTPQKAKRLLAKCNKMNRRLETKYVERLRRDMESGNWYNDTDHIGFDSRGSLVNGQHRLKALSKANVDSVSFNFDFGVEQHLSMDSGKKRSNTDQNIIFKKMGMEDSIMPNSFKSIFTAGYKISYPNITLTNSELYEFWAKVSEQFKICDSRGVFNLGTRANSVTVKSSLFWAYLNGVDIDILSNIANVLNTGITKQDTDIPVIRLRDHLIDLKGTGKDVSLKRAKYTQHCIYSVVNGSTSNRLPSNPQLIYQEYDFN